MVYDGIGAQVIPALIHKALQCRTQGALVVWGTGEQYRDFVFVDDVVDGLLAARTRGLGRFATAIPKAT